ncbi:MAG TPA: SitI3 family protein [Archangium sp.]|nr:SitI3 family protein [Archangium sp.]
MNMALDYSLELSTHLKPVQALDLLAERLGLEPRDEAHLGGPGIWVSAIEQTRLGRSIIEEGFHFSPDLSVGFRLDPNSLDYEKGKRLMLRSTMLLLEQAGKDGVLLFNGENIILQRTAGTLVLNEDWTWTDETRLEEEITLPHERRPLPSPLL